jgi:hypothetical protein
MPRENLEPTAKTLPPSGFESALRPRGHRANYSDRRDFWGPPEGSSAAADA